MKLDSLATVDLLSTFDRKSNSMNSAVIAFQGGSFSRCVPEAQPIGIAPYMTVEEYSKRMDRINNSLEAARPNPAIQRFIKYGSILGATAFVGTIIVTLLLTLAARGIDFSPIIYIVMPGWLLMAVSMISWIIASRSCLHRSTKAVESLLTEFNQSDRSRGIGWAMNPNSILISVLSGAPVVVSVIAAAPLKTHHTSHGSLYDNLDSTPLRLT